MGAEIHRQFLRLTRYERLTLLDRLDDEAREIERRPRGKRPYRREAYRWQYRIEDLPVTIEHPAGGVSRYLVCSRNLSSLGLSFVHGGYIYPGAACRIHLPRFDGEAPELRGTVIACRSVDGVVHEVGMAFQRPIDPKMYLQSGRQRAVGPLDTAELPSLSGTVLYIEEIESERMLLAHALRGTGIELAATGDREEALTLVAGRSFDVVICDLIVQGRCSMELIRQLREAQPDASFILLTAETNRDRVQRAYDAGATHLMPKPYDPSEIFALLYEIQRGARGAAGERRFSTRQCEDGMVEIIANFMAFAREASSRIGEAAQTGNVNQIRDLCLVLKGSAAGVGFAFLSEAANDLIESIDGAQGTTSLDGQLRRVRQLCESLGLEEE